MLYKIVETDNFNGDYPDEKILNLPSIRELHKAQDIADAINAAFGEHCSRYWKVEHQGYMPRPGFEP